jgi:DNA-binding CsgD family transcriptional regulator
MVGTRRPDLTDGQIICLRLVNQHFTSKEIARKLGISPFTVDQRLDGARKKLGADSRADAARRFAMLDAEEIYQPLVYDPARVEKPEIVGHSAMASTGTEFPIGSQETNVFAESDVLSDVITVSNRGLLSRFHLVPFGGARHDLSSGDILLKSINVAFISTLMIGAVVIVITGVMRLFP